MSEAEIPTAGHELHDVQRGQLLQAFEVPEGNNQVTTFETAGPRPEPPEQTDLSEVLTRA